MGCIICTGGTVNKIIDGQQRLTSLTLLLIYINNLQKKTLPQEVQVNLDDLIFVPHFGKRTFNIDVPEREKCMQALFNGNTSIEPDNESAKNMLERYQDIEEYFPEDILAQALDDTAYHNNPQFLPLAEKYGFAPMPVFTKESIAQRADTYLMMAADIWNPNDIRELSGGRRLLLSVH